MIKKLTTTVCLLASSMAMAESIEFTVAESEAYQGYARLQHQHLQLVGQIKDIQVTTNVDRKAYADGDSALSAELMLAKTWSPRLYTLTRIAMATDNTLFSNNSLYNDIGFKMLQGKGITTDLNFGVGTREFPVGQEAFVAFGPTFSFNTVGVWIRREQSLDGGGYRHTASAVWYPISTLRLETAILDEQREKYILPTQGIAAAKISGQRYNLKATYQFTAQLAGLVGIEKLEQKRDDLNMITYAPKTLSVGVIHSF